jgi:hypothetical protein
MEPLSKVCTKCKQEKVIELFIKRANNKDGYDSLCKDCKRESSKIYYENNKNKEGVREKKAARAAKRKAENPKSVLIYLARTRAKDRNLPFDITEDDFQIPELCPLLEIPLFTGPEGKVHRNSPTLDRIEPCLGYVRGNVIVISHKANTVKQDLTVEEFLQVCQNGIKLFAGKYPE